MDSHSQRIESIPDEPAGEIQSNWSNNNKIGGKIDRGLLARHKGESRLNKTFANYNTV